jgi:hypothetical protein
VRLNSIARHLDVLVGLVSRLPAEKFDWAVTGSFGQRLQGVPVVVHDLDLQSDEPTARELDRLLSGTVIEPLAWRDSERIRSLFGRYSVNGLTIEVMGYLSKRMEAAASWSRPTCVREHRVLVGYGSLMIPVLSLAYEEQAYRILGRSDRADLLAQVRLHGNPNASSQ